MQTTPRDGLPQWPSSLGFRQPQHGSGSSSAAALITSLFFHGVLVVGIAWLTLPGGQKAPQREWEQITFIQLEREAPPPPPAPDIAPPPPQPAPPPPPEAPALEPPPEAKGFQTLAVPEVIPTEIPPPAVGPEIDEADFRGEGIEGGRASGVAGGVVGGAAAGTPVEEPAPAEPPLEAGPRYTPMTVPPELKNPQAVARALESTYPPTLRNAGVGGTVVVWLLIDENGKVLRHQIKAGSGQPRLDAAALRVVEVMQFTPAMHHDRRATVWVDIPIIFSAR